MGANLGWWGRVCRRQAAGSALLLRGRAVRWGLGGGRAGHADGAPGGADAEDAAVACRDTDAAAGVAPECDVDDARRHRRRRAGRGSAWDPSGRLFEDVR